MKTLARSTTSHWPAQPRAGHIAASAGSPATQDVLNAGQPMLAPNKILVPVDLSERSLKTLRSAEPMARQFGASLYLLLVVEKAWLASDFGNPPGGCLREELAGIGVRILSDLRHRELGDHFPGETLVRTGEPARTIAEVAQECGIDLIIMSTPTRPSLKHALFGSMAERVAKAAACPVVTLGEKSPSANAHAVIGRHPTRHALFRERLAGFKRRAAELSYRVATNRYVFYGSLLLVGSLVVGALSNGHEELWRSGAALGTATVIIGLLHALLDTHSARETVLPHGKRRAKKP